MVYFYYFFYNKVRKIKTCEIHTEILIEQHNITNVKNNAKN